MICTHFDLRKIKWNLAQVLSGLGGSMICSLDRPTGRMTPQPLSGVTRTVLSKVKSSSLHLELISSLEILEKSKNKNMSQTTLNEHLYALNCLENGEQGSAMSRFLGRATRTMILNSLRRAIDWRRQIQLRGEQVEKRVQKRQNRRKKACV